MRKKTAWADVKKGSIVELGGREWTVMKIKHDGKKAKVKVERRGRTASSVVKRADAVTIIGTATSKPGALFDSSGTAQRWATKKEAKKVMRATLEPGDATKTKPPHKATGSPWDTQADRIESSLDKLLQARLVAVSDDGEQGYYAPPQDPSTIAAHLVLMHGGIPPACDDDEGRMLKAHDSQHAAALKGEGVLAVNHWHTKKRPDA